ncbi:M48 family metallopeptidase [Sedimenticola hydrogenitrophicus]|uniref:M48 family metallopeptidase n=1 Tax=Sedimenticola hydrogenitrophicus TaxID=2967975 RepID=UPI0021A7BBA4|nr:M48 family metallopeptidase [Sedimenticola hydrogenitrophicus]
MQTIFDSWQNKPKYLAMRLLSVILSVALTGCASVDRGMMAVSDGISSRDPVTGQRQINLVSEEQEIRQAEEAMQQILSEAKQKGIKTDGDTPHYEKVTRVFNRLKEVVQRKQLPWEIYVLDSPKWNAFTIGGGKVFVLSGIFQGEIGLKDDSELAAVLAHEMAHVAARHASERGGKLAIAKLADKGLRKEKGFDASFTTNQEAEADKYSALYMALAGYNPSVSVIVWKRMHQASGSYTGDMLFDHPLNDDRAKSMVKYASAVQQYLVPGEINPEHEKLLINNALYSYSKPSTAKAGEGGGFAALLETVANSYVEATEAKTEQLKRQTKKLEQERQAAQRLQFGRLQIANANGGGRGLFGVAVNTTGRQITQAVVALEYLNGQTVLVRDEMQWAGMQPYEQKEFGIPLKQIRYGSVSIRPVYVQLL